ncbi:MAG: AraC family ligand binding domain-containing protein [Paludibacteraceae bacterium]
MDTGMLKTSFFNPILLNIGYAVHDGDWNYNKVNNPFFRIYLVMEGNATLTIKNNKYVLTPGKMYLIPPYTIHNDSCDGHFTLYYIHVFENNDNNICLFEEYDFPIEIDATTFDELMIKRLVEINPHFELKQYDPKSYSSDDVFFNSIYKRASLEPNVLMQTKGIINYLLACFLKSALKSNLNNDNRVLKAAQYIREHLNSKLTLHEIANNSFISEDHLIRLFKRNLKHNAHSLHQ